MISRRLVVSLIVVFALSFCPVFCDPQQKSTGASLNHCQKPMKDSGNTKSSCCRTNFADIKKTAPDNHPVFLPLKENTPPVVEAPFGGCQSLRQMTPAFEPATHTILRA